LKKKLEDTEIKLKELRSGIYNKVKIDMGDYSIYLTSNEWVEQGDGVFSTICGLSSGVATSLDVVFLKDSVLKKHNHPNNYEEIFIISGEMTETITGRKLKQGDLYKILKGVYHEFYSKEGCKCKVVFRPAMIF
jgi:quercetin dioxygenase-like cupin family protein